MYMYECVCVWRNAWLDLCVVKIVEIFLKLWCGKNQLKYGLASSQTVTTEHCIDSTVLHMSDAILQCSCTQIHKILHTCSFSHFFSLLFLVSVVLNLCFNFISIHLTLASNKYHQQKFCITHAIWLLLNYYPNIKCKHIRNSYEIYTGLRTNLDRMYVCVWTKTKMRKKWRKMSGHFLNWVCTCNPFDEITSSSITMLLLLDGSERENSINWCCG